MRDKRETFQALVNTSYLTQLAKATNYQRTSTADLLKFSKITATGEQGHQLEQEWVSTNKLMN